MKQEHPCTSGSHRSRTRGVFCVNASVAVELRAEDRANLFKCCGSAAE